MRKAVDGLVLRVIQSGDNDRRLLVLTAEEGKMWVNAKGARSVRSKTAVLCRAFAYINFEYYEKNGFRWLAAGSLNSDFSQLNRDLEVFSLASYIAQVAEEITGEGVEADEILKTTLNTLYAIEKSICPCEQIKAAYELYAVRVSGLLPNLWECEDCGKNDFSSEGNLWLDVMNGSVVCTECLRTKSGGAPLPETDRFDVRNILLPLDTSALEAMRYVSAAEPKRLFAFGLGEDNSRKYFYRACETYLLNHLERDFSTLQFYKSIKE